jgi:hypothetical protein
MDSIQDMNFTSSISAGTPFKEKNMARQTDSQNKPIPKILENKSKPAIITHPLKKATPNIVSLLK